jgi:hypothetical protein
MSQQFFAETFPRLIFESAAKTSDVSDYNGPILAYTIRNVFWNKTDKEVFSIIADLLKAMKQHPAATLLINEMLSPSNA